MKLHGMPMGIRWCDGSILRNCMACYFAASLPVEQALTVPISEVLEQTELFISKIAGYPMKVLLFQVKGNLETLAKMVLKLCLCLIDQNTPFSLLVSDFGRKIFLYLETLAKMVSKLCLCLIDQNTPFSMLVSDSGRKIFLFPQASSATTDRLSAFECSGHFILNNKNDYDEVSEDVLVKRLSSVSIDEDELKSIEQLCCNVAN